MSDVKRIVTQLFDLHLNTSIFDLKNNTASIANTMSFAVFKDFDKAPAGTASCYCLV